METIRAAIFDLDGTLLDTIEDIADSMNLVLEQNSLPTHPVDAYKLFVGDGIRELVRRTLPETRRTTVGIDRMVEAMTEEYDRRWRMKTKSMWACISSCRSTRRRSASIACNMASR